MKTSYLKKAAERVFWTAVEGGVSTLTIEMLHLPPQWIPVGAAVLAALKTWAAKHVGSADDPSIGLGK